MNVLTCREQSCLKDKNAMSFCDRLGSVAVEKMLSDGRPERTASNYDDVKRTRIRARAPRGIRIRPGIGVSTDLRLKKCVTDIAPNYIFGEVSKFAS